MLIVVFIMVNGELANCSKMIQMMIPGVFKGYDLAA